MIKEFGICIFTFILISILGCSSSPGETDRIKLPDVTGDKSSSYPISSPFSQWIEKKEVFSNDGIPELVIHTKSKKNGIESWKTETICWLDKSKDVEIGYHCVSIQTLDYYEYDYGPVKIERAYWAVDINDNNMKDLLVVEWKTEQDFQAKTKQNKERDNRIIRGDPTQIRLIQRKAIKGEPFGIELDRRIEWSRVLNNPMKHKGIFDSAINKCETEKWKQRLIKMKYMLSLAYIDLLVPVHN